MQAMGNTSAASYYAARAAANLNGLNSMWMAANGTWAVYKDGIGRLIGPNFATWYPDATSQLFPVLYGALSPSDPRSVAVYNKFNSAWPGWPDLSFNAQDQFPWVMITGAAAQMGNSARVNTYINNIQNKYVSKGFPWPWYNMEAGWFVRLNSYMAGKRPF
ncbi:MAG: hypothetical protein ACE14L_14280 [Terriglobales bacterium]